MEVILPRTLIYQPRIHLELESGVSPTPSANEAAPQSLYFRAFALMDPCHVNTSMQSN